MPSTAPTLAVPAALPAFSAPAASGFAAAPATVPSPVRPSGALCPDPVFILGAPRSGTSILVWALAQHPRLKGSAESNLLYHLFGDGHIETVFEALHDQPGSSWLREAGIERADFLRHLGLGINSLFSSRS